MNGDMERAMRRSSKDFVDVVWPSLGPILGGGDLIPVETVTANDFAATLDRTAGIDAWIVQAERHLFGLGSRVQWGEPSRWFPYRTFTIRLKLPTGRPTEYAKRREQIATPGSIYPAWTAQAYIQDTTRALLAATIARTSDVIAAVDLGIGYEKRNPDGTRFWCTPWADLWHRGCLSLHVYDAYGWHSRSEVA